MDIMCGIDVSNKSLECAIACGSEDLAAWKGDNNASGRLALAMRLEALRLEKHADKIRVAYEAGGVGYQIYEEFQAQGIDCRVLAPGLIRKSVRDKKLKTDSGDARLILQTLRNSFLAGEKLPEVWVKPKYIREDLEAVRARIDTGASIGRAKTRIRALLRVQGIELPEKLDLWTKAGRAALEALDMSRSVRLMLELRLIELDKLERERDILDEYMRELAAKAEYAAVVSALMEIRGVGVLTAVTFALEIGDMERFPNRRTLAAYLGLVPTSYETGERNDRKGHITRQGSSRVRKLLNQAAWRWCDEGTKNRAFYERVKRGTKKRTKVAIVAAMRKLSIEMWHCGLEAQRASLRNETRAA